MVYNALYRPSDVRLEKGKRSFHLFPLCMHVAGCHHFNLLYTSFPSHFPSGKAKEASIYFLCACMWQAVITLIFCTPLFLHISLQERQKKLPFISSVHVAGCHHFNLLYTSFPSHFRWVTKLLLWACLLPVNSFLCSMENELL